MHPPPAGVVRSPTFHVALYSGVFLHADAISDSLRLKLDILTELAGAGVPVRVTVFTQATDYNRDCIRRAATVHQLATHREFHEADLHFFEFGIRYELFNAIILLRGKPVLAAYHNVTPPALAEPELRPTLEASLVQKNNLFWAHRVACVSEFNRDDLLALGIPRENLTVLHLPPAIRPKPRSPRSERVRLLFVGRFVRAKGVIDLVDAVATVARSGTAGFTVTLAGHRAFSSPGCIELVEDAIAREGLGGVVELVLSPSDEQLADLYAASDALVIPSYHEGFCLPVIESMAAGCYVIAYDAGNLPNIVGGLATLVPTGDVSALAEAIRSYVTTVQTARESGETLWLPVGERRLSEDRWREAVAAHVEQYSPQAYRRGFLDMLAEAAAGSTHGELLVEALEQDSLGWAIGAGA